MAYSVPWDETRPPGATTPVSDVDTVIQDVQIAVRERIEQVIPTWSADGTDPKFMGPGTGRASVGTLAARPALADFDGQFYFAEDTGQMFVGDAALAWQLISGGIDSGSLLNRPAGVQGDTYLVTGDTAANAEEQQTYFRDDVGWSPFAPFTAEFQYDVDQAPGSRVVGVPQRTKKIFTFFVSGTTSISGAFAIDLAELTAPLEAATGIKNVSIAGQVKAVFAMPTSEPSGTGPSPFRTITYFGLGAGSVITFWYVDMPSHSVVSSGPFQAYIMLVLN